MQRWLFPTVRGVVALGIALLAGAALAQTGASSAVASRVALAGMLGSKALLVVDGGAPKSIAAGESHQGVKVLSTTGDQAVVEHNGKRYTLRVGEAPVNAGGSSASAGRGTRITLAESSGGHFMAAGQINGKAVQFMVDTGATTIAMGIPDAERAGINYKSGQPVRMATANGETMGWRVRIASVRIAEVEVFDVEAVVTQQPMPFLLLGNSFLSRFDMRRDNNGMVLNKRF